MTGRPIPYVVPEEDYLFPEDVPTIKVKVRCRCGVRRVRGIQLVESLLPMLRRLNLPPNTMVGRAWCDDCRTMVKVPAKALHLSSAP